MNYRTLGQTQIAVSTICMGCWGLAGDFHWGSQDDADSIATVHAALDAGINFFDNAEAYGAGRSEEVLGRALLGKRADAVIATKVSAENLEPVDLIRACENSLVRLQTDYIDLYQIHWPNWDIPLENTLEALEQLISQGKVRAIGVSNFGRIDLHDLLTLARPATNQLPYSLLFRAIEYDLQSLCVEQDIGILCYSSLLHGLLSGAYDSAADLSPTRARTRHFSSTWPHTRHHEPGCEAEITDALQEIGRICRDLQQPMSSVALAWLQYQPGVTAVVTGLREPQQVIESAASADLVLSSQTLQQLDMATDAVKQKLGPNLDMWNSESRMR